MHVKSFLFALITSVSLVQAMAGDAKHEWTSENGVYALSFESSIEPIEINQMHSWVLHITADGAPVANAKLSIAGGMPAHKHGLPTSPRVTDELSDGQYRLEGIRFHMHGQWQLSIEIIADGKADTVIVDLTL